MNTSNLSRYLPLLFVVAAGCQCFAPNLSADTASGQEHSRFLPDASNSLLLAAARADAPVSPPPAVLLPLTISNTTPPMSVLARPKLYDYAPSAMLDDTGKYRIWWCAGVAGDYVGYAESNTLSSFSNHAEKYYWPNRSGGDPAKPQATTSFDGIHRCDPSVIRVRDTYYMYFGGGASSTEKCIRKAGKTCKVSAQMSGFPKQNSVSTTYIGLATSSDGIRWNLQNSGLPLLYPRADSTNPVAYVKNGFGTPSGEFAGASLYTVYGIGQPSVVSKDGLFYLSFTDSTAIGRNTGNGAGIFVIRSADPYFRKDVEEVRCTGDTDRPANSGTCSKPYWRKLAPRERPSTRYAVLESFSVDLAYSDSLGTFVIASHTVPKTTEILFFDANFKKLGSVGIPAANWHDGPAIVRRPDGHMLSSGSREGACVEIPVDIISGATAVADSDPFNWDLWRWGAVLKNPPPCSKGK